MTPQKHHFSVMKADNPDFDARTQMSRIFTEGFSQWLGYFSKDKDIIAKAFAHIFVLDQFYAAVMDQKIASMAACTNCKDPAIRLDKKELRKHLGIMKGSIAGVVLKREFESPCKDPTPGTASIEFVGTSPEFRGQGAASDVIQYIIENTQYKEYLIEVADTNIPALKLYIKLGFKEYKRKSLPRNRAKKAGINSIIFLKYVK